MDEIDQKLISLLAENSRASLKQLAGAVDLSRTAVTDRIRKLEQQGEIASYTITRPARGVPCLLFVKTATPSCEQLSPRLKAIPEIRSMRSLAGSIDIVLELELEGPQRLNAIREQIAAWPEVSEITTASVLKLHWKR